MPTSATQETPKPGPDSPRPGTVIRSPADARPTGEGLRWAFVAMGVALILVATNLLRPPHSATADQKTLAGSIEAAMNRRGAHKPAQEPRLIGELVGRDYRVRCYAGVPAPTYTVLSLEGSVLAEGLNLRELPKRFPNLDPSKMILTSPTTKSQHGLDDSFQLMHADEAPTPDR